MAAYLGPAATASEAKLDYVNFYAHLHRVVDEKIGRLLDALGDPADPASLRSRTVIFRCADHGEMGLSHGGLRQKAFNAYEETIHIPLVVSNPVLFPKPRRDRRARLAGRRRCRRSRRSPAPSSTAQANAGATWRRSSPTRAAPERERLRAADVDLGAGHRPPRARADRSRTRSTSPTTTTRRRPRSRTCPGSRTGSARSGPRRHKFAALLRSRRARRRPSTRCTTSSATRTSATTWSTGAAASRSREPIARCARSSASGSTR